MPRAKEWSDNEIERLKKLYPSKRDFDEVLDAFPERTINAIRVKASRLGLRRPLPPGNIHPADSLMVTRDKRNGEKGYLFRCGNCNTWIKVGEERVEKMQPVICEKCGTLCYFS
jgi:hypothetical protein